MMMTLYNFNQKEVGFDFGLIEIKLHIPEFYYRLKLKKHFMQCLDKHISINKMFKDKHEIVYEGKDFTVVVSKYNILIDVPYDVNYTVRCFVIVLLELYESVKFTIEFSGSLESESKDYISKKLIDKGVSILI